MFFHGTPGSRRVARWADQAAQAPRHPADRARSAGLRPVGFPARPHARRLAGGRGRAGRCAGPRAVRRGGRLGRRPLCRRLRLADRGPAHPRRHRQRHGPARRSGPGGRASAPLPGRLRCWRGGCRRWRVCASASARSACAARPAACWLSVAASLPEVDRAIFRRPRVRALLLDDAREALRQGRARRGPRARAVQPAVGRSRSTRSTCRCGSGTARRMPRCRSRSRAGSPRRCPTAAPASCPTPAISGCSTTWTRCSRP